MPVCNTCPHACELAPGRIGLCRARKGGDDAVASESYGRITSLALDPIEKKPIARWRPGTTVLSAGGYGCNMRCSFCQNASIAQAGVADLGWRQVTPEELVQRALGLVGEGCVGIAYTYNEPLVWWEFVRDTATRAHAVGLANVLVSNGMASACVIEELLPFVDAANIDLKCFDEEGYRALGGDLQTVKQSIEMFASTPTCHLEVTTLVVPGLSDDEGQIEDMARWIATLDGDIVYHLTRFFPMHRMADVAPTDKALMRRLAKRASRFVDCVLLGNM